MGDRLPLFVVRDLVTGEGSEFSAPERLVALAVADHMGQSGECWPSRRTIAAWTGLGETAVRIALKGLSEGERAIFERKPGRPGRESYTYVLRAEGARQALRAHDAPGARDTTPSPRARGAREDPKGRATRSQGARHATTEGLIEGPIEGPNGNGLAAVAAARTLEIVKVNGWPPDWADRLVESWSRYGSVSHGQLGRALKPLQAAHAFDDVQRGLEAWLAAGKGSYGVYSFVRDAVRWINGDGAAKSNSATATTSRALSALLGGRR